MVTEFFRMLEEVESLEHTIEHMKCGGINLMEEILILVYGVAHPLIVAIRENLEDVERKEALSELMEAQISYLEANKNVHEMLSKYMERGLKLMEDQHALDDDD